MSGGAGSAAEPASVPKPSLDEYKQWLTVDHSHDLAKEKSRYEQVAVKAKSDVEESNFWRALLSTTPEADDEYTAQTAYKLFSSAEQYKPQLFRKSWSSFLLKTYRKNVVTNFNWPSPPVEGWLNKENWFERVNDIIRTTMVVKYLDGVEFLAGSIAKIASGEALPFRCDFEAKDEGYYAAHVYVTVEVDVPSFTWDTVRLPLQLEIQLTTQLQDVIRRLTHTDYEQRRVTAPSNIAWQWQYRNEQFVPNYLGHILHYIEGMIMEVRERPNSRSSGDSND